MVGRLSPASDWMEKVSLSGWEALADARREKNTHCDRWVSVTSVKLEKARLSGREYLAGFRREIKTHCVGQVKLCGRDCLAVI